MSLVTKTWVPYWSQLKRLRRQLRNKNWPGHESVSEHVKLLKLQTKKAPNLVVWGFVWWAFPDLNWGPADYESDALTN